MGCRRALALMGVVSGISLNVRAQTPQGGVDPALTSFVVRIENVSTAKTLKLALGGSVAVPASAGVWVVHSGINPIFAPGETQAGQGLEGLAEAGLANAFAATLHKTSGVRAAGVFDTPLMSRMMRRRMARGAAKATDGGTSSKSRMLGPGQRFEFTVSARPGDRLSLALMIAQSNDGFVATGHEGIALFDAAHRPISGDATAQLSFWDAGTEVNEEPGLGRNQGLRQGAPHAGDPERRPVRLMSDAEYGTGWPPVIEMIRVTLEPRR